MNTCSLFECRDIINFSLVTNMANQATKPKLTIGEKKYRKSVYPDVSKVINKNPLCTSCNCSVRKMVVNGKPQLHPFLNTLLCDKCFNFYGDGEFSVDEDGGDKYCRWCGQGGTLFLCSTCTAGFCEECMKRNLPDSVLKDVEDDEWQCFCCKVQPLYDLRALAWAAVEHSTSLKTTKLRGNKYNSESDSDSDYISTKKSMVRFKGTKTKPISRMDKTNKIAYLKLHKIIGEVISVCDTITKKAKDVKSKKLLQNDVVSVEAVEEIGGRIMKILDPFKESMDVINGKVTDFITEWKEAVATVNEEDMKKSKAKNTDSDESSESEDVDSNNSKSKRNYTSADSDKKSGSDLERAETSCKPNKQNKSKSKEGSNHSKDSDDVKRSSRPKRTISKQRKNESDEDSDDVKSSRTPKKTMTKQGKNESDEDSGDVQSSSRPKKSILKQGKNDCDEDSDDVKSSRTPKKTITKQGKNESDEDSGDVRSNSRPKKSISKRGKNECDEDSDDVKSSRRHKKTISKQGKNESDEDSDDVKSSSRPKRSISNQRKMSDFESDRFFRRTS